MSEFKPATELFEAVTYDQIMEPVSEQIGIVREQWAGIGKEEIIKRMPDLTDVTAYKQEQSVAIINPTDEDGKPRDIDESSSIVLTLPYANGWTPHHFIRTKVLQEVVAPNSRVIAVPNNGWGQRNYKFDVMDELYRIDPITSVASITANTLREINKETSLGRLSISGYSQGGNVAIRLAAIARGDFSINRVNADEAVSKIGRRALGIMADFAKSGNDYPGAIEQADIRALSEVMSGPALALDMARAPFVQLKSENRKLLSQGMVGSVERALTELLFGHNNLSAGVKVGFIEDSKMFDPESIKYDSANRCGNGNLRHYVGDGFKGHASADDVFLHAAMVNDGFKVHR